MRYKDMSGKEIVNVNKGSRLGILGQTDLEINEKTGKIEAFVIPNYKWFGLKKEGEETKIRWESIRKIGEDMIIIDADEFE
ncbi:YlmC/YmxH family sporulation protein [Virgibacillus sp. YIM 98842]|jgi:YlmC/YmxH family sporulation protein|uniref:YlmC/YmxH family sporulation protein n=1 Tax=Virgibacillus sp. YIM 98842 TaxID=2663533 RepID=UPI0013DD3B99|nr:YlmC/YmxH family sporulation protein [Virgibacillus sp. YIM 98842]